MNINPYVVVLGIYILIVYAIGFVASRSLNKMSDFVLANRSLSAPVTALGAGASDMSGWLLMALPGAIFSVGASQLWMPISLMIGAYINWKFIAKRLRIYTEVAKDSLTIPAYFNNRFHSKTKGLRIATAIVVIVFFTFYASAGFFACAVLAEKIFHLSYFNALMISAIVMVCYTLIGGFLAVNWIDFFQGTLMFLSLLIVPLITFGYIGEDVSIVDKVNMEGYFDMFSVSVIGISTQIGWGLGYFGQPHILTRFMAIKRHHDISIARKICMSWMILSLIGAIFTGFLGRAYFEGALDNPETVFIALSTKLFNPWIAGILLSALLSAIMSTVTAQLLSSSSVLAEDIYHALIRKKAGDKELLFVSRMALLVIAVVAVFIALDPQTTILKLIGSAWAGLGASFGPVILISLYWARMTRRGAVFGILVGALTVLFWQLMQKNTHITFFQLYEMIPGFILNTITIFLVSIWDKPPSKEIINDFDKVVASTR